MKLFNVYFYVAIKPFLVTALVLTLLIYGIPSQAQSLDRPPEDDEVNYSPVEGDVSATNPPAFTWLTIQGVNSYIVQYSTSPSFDPAPTTTVRDIDMVVHIPTEILKTGTWYWRYGYTKDGNDLFSRTRRFEVPDSAIHFPLITADEFISRIPKHRPRLYFSPELVEEIRSDTQGRFDHITKKVVEEADKILAMNEPLFNEPELYQKTKNPTAAYVIARNTFFPYSDRMITLALAYLYTGDQRFADEARRRLMHLMTWDVEGVSTAVRHDGLAMSIAENATPVFDWIYNTLNEEERRKCKEVLTARMVQINRDVHRARPMESRPFASHAGRFVGFAIEGGIVLAHEVPEAKVWLDYTLKLLWSTYPAWGGHEGGWHEGISYWTGYMLKMIRVVHELDIYGIPLKDKPFFRNTGYYGLYVGYPFRPTSAFGDLCHNPIGKSTGVVTFMLSNLYGKPYFRWHSEKIGSVPSGRNAISMYINEPDVKSYPPVNLPQSHIFKDIGLVAMHSNLADPDNNVMMLFTSDPYGGISHNHASQNAFVIEAFKEPLAISSGYRQTYGNTHHREWIWQTKAHNSILIDFEGQVPRQRSSSGEIIDYQEHEEYVYAVGDATRAYGGRLERFHRHILFVRPDYFVILDDLKTSGSSSTYQWLLHAKNEMQVDDQNNVVVSCSGNARLAIRFLTPSNLVLKQHTGFDPPVEDPDVPARSSGPTPDQFHLVASTTDPAPSQIFVTVGWVDRDSNVFTTAYKNPNGKTSFVIQKDKEGSLIKKIENTGIRDNALFNKTIQNATLLTAKGGIAIRVGDDLILWKETNVQEIEAVGISSRKAMEVKRGFFKRN